MYAAARVTGSKFLQGPREVADTFWGNDTGINSLRRTRRGVGGGSGSEQADLSSRAKLGASESQQEGVRSRPGALAGTAAGEQAEPFEVLAANAEIDSDVSFASGSGGRSAAASDGEDALLAAVDAATRVIVGSGGDGGWAPPAPAARCKIYILDPSLELAPTLGIPSCNLSEAWPFGQTGQGVEGLHRSPHWAAQHASGYWVAQAIANGPHYTKFMREADLIYVHT